MEQNGDIGAMGDGFTDLPLRRHPLSAAWPDLKSEESQAMTESMRAHGFDESQPVVRHEGMVLDGWHRYKKALQLGVEPIFTDYTGDDPAGFVIARHKARRHISKAEIAEAILRCREWRPAEGGRPRKPDRNDPVSEPAGGRTNRQLAEEAGVSVGTLKRAKQSVRNAGADPEGSGNAAKSSRKPISTGSTGRESATERAGRDRPVRLGEEARENGTITAPDNEEGHAAPDTEEGHAAPGNADVHAGRLRDVGARLAGLRAEMEEALTDAADAVGDGEAWDLFRRETDADEWLRFFDSLGIKITWERRQPPTPSR